MEISGKTGLFCLIGSPVGHSGSPAMHNFSFQQLGLNYVYLAFDVPLEQLPAAMTAIRAFQVRGFNVTMPCKTAVVPYLDALSPAAEIIGAVNTVVNENDRLVGHITDGVGYVRDLREHGVAIQGKRLTILGSGGAATAIQIQCALDGAEQIHIFCRDDSFLPNAKRTIEKIRQHAPACQAALFDLADTRQLRASIAQSDILTNATSVGMKPLDGVSLLCDPAVFHEKLVVTDVVYNPKMTKLLLDAQRCGRTVLGGSGMLLWQGAEAFRLFTGQEMPVAQVAERYFQ